MKLYSLGKSQLSGVNPLTRLTERSAKNTTFFGRHLVVFFAQWFRGYYPPPPTTKKHIFFLSSPKDGLKKIQFRKMALTKKQNKKKMFNQDEGKMECAVGNREMGFLAVQESRDCFVFISDVVICGIYLSLALGTAKFKQLD